MQIVLCHRVIQGCRVRPFKFHNWKLLCVIVKKIFEFKEFNCIVLILIQSWSRVYQHTESWSAIWNIKIHQKKAAGGELSSTLSTYINQADSWLVQHLNDSCLPAVLKDQPYIHQLRTNYWDKTGSGEDFMKLDVVMHIYSNALYQAKSLIRKRCCMIDIRLVTLWLKSVNLDCFKIVSKDTSAVYFNIF